MFDLNLTLCGVHSGTFMLREKQTMTNPKKKKKTYSQELLMRTFHGNT